MQIVTPSRVSLRSLNRFAMIAAILAASFLYSPMLAFSGQVNLGPNVYIFNPSMPLGDIQATVDSIATQQVSNQFGTQRYALLFEPGTYGSSATPLNFQLGYYTTVAGLGQSPADVVINGSIDVYNQCTDGSCVASNNFWRSLSNLTINVTNPTFGCYAGEFWAVSQASPMRRVLVNGNATLMDYCTGPSFASGGFIADSQFEEEALSVVRNSNGSLETARSMAGAMVSGIKSSPVSSARPRNVFRFRRHAVALTPRSQ